MGLVVAEAAPVAAAILVFLIALPMPLISDPLPLVNITLVVHDVDAKTLTLFRLKVNLALINGVFISFYAEILLIP